MTYKDLAIKILTSDAEFFDQGVDEKVLLGLVNNETCLCPKQLDLEITPYRCLPCELEVFKINGQDADVDDFGTSCGSGDCMEGTCHREFCPNTNPTNDVLRKYKITESQFYQICDELAEKLYVDDCGWCS